MSVKAPVDTRSTLITAAERIFAAKGYAAVGINEVLSSVGVPKGSFYHYFASKDAFGVAVLERYFEDYLADMDRVLADEQQDWATRLDGYWASWRATQGFDDCQGKCLAVKLGAEVADMSEPMRMALRTGIAQIVDRLELAITGGLADGSISVTGPARSVAESLYGLWLGASVMAKVNRNLDSLDHAKVLTDRSLGR